MGLELSKESRLRTPAQFEHALSKGIKVVSSGLVVVAKPTELPGPRLGLVVSRKVGSAVVRNRVKRSLRESFRLQKNRLSGVDIVVIARPSVKDASFAAIHQELTNCLLRISQKLQLPSITSHLN